ELLELAGAHNVFADLPQPSAPVSLEAIAARDPDIVLLAGESSPTFVDRPEWQSVTAVRERRFARIEGSEFSWPSPRSLAAADRLAAAIGTAPR
ncbi:MAG: ABC transporter substrate-binding protein, partial [Gemmatimonadales bacterium]|nr:ABC transporter substrate-binding protein [Gemmatimonadales bacterium]